MTRWDSNLRLQQVSYSRPTPYSANNITCVIKVKVPYIIITKSGEDLYANFYLILTWKLRRAYKNPFEIEAYQV